MGENSDLLNEFVLEAKAHIEEMESGLLLLEEGQEDRETINRIFRAAHSIKGTASFFELNKIVDLSHHIENLFGEIREERLNVTSNMIDVLLEAVDVLKNMIQNPSASEECDTDPSVAAIQACFTLSQAAAKDEENHTEKISDALDVWNLWDQLTCNVEQETKEQVQEAAKVVAKKTVPSVREEKQREVVIEDSVRVNVGLLDDLLNLAGEMVLRRNQLLRISQSTDKQVAQLNTVAKSIDELTTKLQKKIMKTRMQPIANVFNKFPRIVRDLSRKVGKEVDLTMHGINVELDRSLIEALVDPMTHLVRNALDHGIEPPEVRELNGKARNGSLNLSAYHESGRVIIDVSDDGSGIDLEKVKTKAVQKGLVNDKEIAAMSEAEVMNLILTPGFSTADEVTDISGRGVGMDVVKTNIEKIGGKIEILSELHAGTTVRLMVPLTLAIISSLIVVADGQSFVIPQANVRELVLILPDESSENKRVDFVYNRPVLHLRDQLLPLVKLSDILKTGTSNETKGQLRKFYEDKDILRILIVKAGNRNYGLVVDSVYDTEEILVKPLSTVLGNCGLYSGSTVLGDGSIAMILDTESIRLRAGIALTSDNSWQTSSSLTKGMNEEKQYLLLFKCSGGEMLGIDLAMVSRVEEVAVSRLQKIGDKYFISLQGRTTRVIRPENYLPLTQQENKLSKVYVILPKLENHSIGIIAEEIHDAIYTTVTLDSDGVCGVGILGSAQINDTVVTLLNLYELFVKAAPEYYERSSERQKEEQKYTREDSKEQKKTVLLAEDLPFFSKVIKSYLESDGYDVITASNGREALEILEQTEVAAVVSDIEMPIMTGFELVRAIRSRENLRQLPVIALTSLTGEVNKEKGLRAGFDVYEYKLDRTKLLDSVRNILQQKAGARRKVK